MPGVQFGQQIDMNGLKITELAPGVAGTDAVNVSQLSAFADGFSVLVGDGALSTFTITHNFALTNKDDFIARVAEVSTGQEYNVEITSVNVNSFSVTFGFVPTLNSFRVSTIPVR